MRLRRRPWSAPLAGIVAAVLIAGAAPVAAAAPAPTGSWSFNGSFRNAAGTSLTMAGIGGPTFTEVTIRGKTRTALAIADDQGASLTNIPSNGRRTFTIDIWFEFDEMDGYGRILSFGPNDKDEALYLYDGYPYLYDEKSNEAIVVAPNRFTHVRVTRNGATKAMRVYVNGTLAIRYKDVLGQYTLRSGRAIFFQDDSHGIENGIGTIAAVKIWNRVVAP